MPSMFTTYLQLKITVQSSRLYPLILKIKQKQFEEQKTLQSLLH